MANKRVKHVIVDSGAFIRNAQILTVAENVYTIREVVSEIKDKATRQRLQVLPYEIHFKDPPPDAIKQVTEFSKKTGDYPSLSAVDIRVMALVYQLEKEKVGTDHIKLTPERNISWTTTKGQLENPRDIAGFYIKKKDEKVRTSTNEITDAILSENITEQLQQVELSEEGPDDSNSSKDVTIKQQEKSPVMENVMSSFKDDDNPNAHLGVTDIASMEQSVDGDSIEQSTYVSEGDTIKNEDLEDESDEDPGDNDEDYDDGEGWITPSNIKEVRLAMGDKNVEKADITVGCMTTDFAMQNVLMQMGLNVVSVDGMLIKRAKSYVLRCYACNKITKNMMKEFCHHCGNKTLQKVSMTIEEDGSIRYFLSKKRPISTRGMKFSLPKPQGGKHACNPILVEDQQCAQQRMSKKSKKKYDIMDDDYLAYTSPFAPTDTTSRSALLGIRNQGHNFRSKRNPNENKKVYGRRK